MKLYRLPHKQEQQISAISMIPGILLAIMYKPKGNAKVLRYIAYSYIITCIGSIIYHTYCANHPGYHPKWLRLDITCQQISLYLATLICPLGIRGVLLLLPFATLIGLCDLADYQMCDVALIGHACSILVLSVFGSIRTTLQWMVSFATYAMKHVYPESYTISQTLWHVLCHINIYTSWGDFSNMMNV